MDCFRISNSLEICISFGDEGYYGLLLMEKQEGTAVPVAYLYDPNIGRISDEIMKFVGYLGRYRGLLSNLLRRNVLRIGKPPVQACGGFGLSALHSIATLMNRHVLRVSIDEAIDLLRKAISNDEEFYSRVNEFEVAAAISELQDCAEIKLNFGRPGPDLKAYSMYGEVSRVEIASKRPNPKQLRIGDSTSLTSKLRGDMDFDLVVLRRKKWNKKRKQILLADAFIIHAYHTSIGTSLLYSVDKSSSLNNVEVKSVAELKGILLYVSWIGHRYTRKILNKEFLLRRLNSE